MCPDTGLGIRAERTLKRMENKTLFNIFIFHPQHLLSDQEIGDPV